MKIWVLAAALALTVSAQGGDLPRSWIDPDTGHRIVRISDVPGSLSLYFNYNAYTPSGDKMVFSLPDGIATFDFKTREVRQIVKGKVRLLFVGRTSRLVYYEVKGEGAAKTIFAADADSGKAHIVARLERGSIQAINADDSLLAGVEELADAKLGKPANKGEMMKARLAARIPMTIFAIDVKTGKKRVLVESTDWLNHLQFSPTDPNLLLFCHEGAWHKVDRIWTIRLDDAAAKPVKLHARTMQFEIAGHEWFSADGRIVWYDLQTPRGEVFWVAGVDLATGRRIRHSLTRDQWSVHFNASPDGNLFSGDGGDASMVAHAANGKWIYLFRPKPLPFTVDPGDEAYDPGLIAADAFEAERLVNMKDHNYRLEPNARFSPDGKWIIFRSDMLGGASQVYMVEIAKAVENENR